jgi:hypothetical protein
MTSRKTLSRCASLALVCVFGVFVLGACQETKNRALTVAPDENFSALAGVLGRHCGTLDCHGDPARSLRVYGRFGLRADARDRPGGRATTNDEVAATYESLVLLDPETLSLVLEEQVSVEEWMGFSKAVGRVSHKGGEAMLRGSTAEACLRSWAEGRLDVDSCAKDAFGPIPLPGETF